MFSYGPRWLDRHEVTFHVNAAGMQISGGGTLSFGIVPAAEASYRGSAGDVGFVYYSGGTYYAERSFDPTEDFDIMYGAGDKITVVADLDANKIAFCRNGVAVGSAQTIPAHKAYYFVFEASSDGNSVTIVEMK